MSDHPHWYDVEALMIAKDFTPENSPKACAGLQIRIVEAMKKSATLDHFREEAVLLAMSDLPRIIARVMAQRAINDFAAEFVRSHTPSEGKEK